MNSFFLLLACVGTIVTLVRVLRDPRFSRRFKVNSLLAVAGFTAYCAIGSGIVILFATPAGAQATGESDAAILLVIGFFLAWVFYGTLWLVRLAPRTRQPPRWLLHPWGWLDLLLLGLAGLCAAGLLLRAGGS